MDGHEGGYCTMFRTGRTYHEGISRSGYVSTLLLGILAKALYLGASFFWLGHIPCVSVLLVGMVVAIQTYERRTIYTSAFPFGRVVSGLLILPSVDDGTSVVDCIIRHPTFMLPKAEYPPRKKGPGTLGEPANDDLELRRPITWVGSHVHVIGRVVRRSRSTCIYVKTISESFEYARPFS